VLGDGGLCDGQALDEIADDPLPLAQQVEYLPPPGLGQHVKR
jgi:hypothetical protein